MEKIVVLSTSFLLIGGISWFFFGKKDKKESEPVEETAGTKTVELNISGMHCAGCAAGIEGTLKSVDGIVRASVNFATSKGIFEFQPSKITEEEIINKIRQLGYDASLDIESVEKKSS